MSSKNRMAYVVSMANGMEPWLEREIGAMIDRNVDIVLYITKYRHDPLYGPETHGWPYCTLSLAPLALHFPEMLRRMAKPGLLSLALRTRTLLELAVASRFAIDMLQRGIQHIHAGFLDKKLTVAFYCAELLGLPLTAMAHAHDVYFCQKPEMLRIAGERCAAVFAVSDLARDWLISCFGLASDKVMVNRLFVDVDEYRAASGRVYILIAGRFESWKGHRYLFDAVKLLGRQDTRILVAGSGPYDVKRVAEESGLSNKTVFLGRLGREHLRFILGKATVYCQPSIIEPGYGMEGIPVILMEAMAAGLPVVATRTGAVEELVERVLVPERDSAALAAALSNLIDNPDVRMRQGARNVQIVREKYSERNMDIFAQTLLAIRSPE